MIRDFIADNVGNVDPESPEALAEILAPFEKLFLAKGRIRYESGMKSEDLARRLEEIAFEVYEAKEKALGDMPNGLPVMRELERVIMLRVVDEYWMEHIDAMSRKALICSKP